jgi:hypothetical protein
MSLDGSDFLRPNMMCDVLYWKERYPSTVGDGELQIQCSRIGAPMDGKWLKMLE